MLSTKQKKKQQACAVFAMPILGYVDLVDELRRYKTKHHEIPSGELSHSNGKIHHAINGKIHYFNGPFSIAMLVHQRVSSFFFPDFSCDLLIFNPIGRWGQNWFPLIGCLTSGAPCGPKSVGVPAILGSYWLVTVATLLGDNPCRSNLSLYPSSTL